VLANFADEYGDLKNGADTDERLGPVRGMQRGDISFAQMKRALIILTVVTILSGTSLVWLAFGTDPALIAAFCGMGAFALFSAIAYTVGKKAFGYYGLGDFFCFVCFGPLAVCGGYFLYGHAVDWPQVCAGVGVGLMVNGVLNLNNMRDRNTDAATGKNTLVVRIGTLPALIYHAILLVGGFCFLLASLCAIMWRPLSLLFAIGLVAVCAQAVSAFKVSDPRAFDPLMRPLSLTIVLSSALFAVLVAL
jgi:1,4-dihydroxy-2-naphthoate octaprenyltransferase